MIKVKTKVKTPTRKEGDKFKYNSIEKDSEDMYVHIVKVAKHKNPKGNIRKIVYELEQLPNTYKFKGKRYKRNNFSTTDSAFEESVARKVWIPIDKITEKI